MKKFIYLFVALTALCSCVEKFQENWEELRMDKTTYTYYATDVKGLLYIYYNGEWTAEVTEGADWVTLDRTSGSGVYGNHIRFEANQGVSRAAVVTVKGGETVWTAKIVQKGIIAAPKIIFQKTTVNILANKTGICLAVDSNLPMSVFRNIVPEVAYPDTVSAWLTSVTILEKEDSIEIPDMPDGTRRYVQVDFPANQSGKNRQASIELAVVDASGERTSGAVGLQQSNETASISLPAQDRVNKLGGVRTIPVTTNAGDDIENATVEITYGAISGFISDAHVTAEANLVYTVAENLGDEARTATITVKYDGQSASMTVMQKAQVTSYSDYTIESIYDFLDWASDYSVWKATDNIKLGTDLDLTGQTYVPRDFSGTFDGQGHVISGINFSLGSNAGFFTTLTGTLKNVTFGSEENHGRIVCTSTAANSSAALIPVLSGNASIKDVTSYVDIYASGSGVRYVGGIAGVCSSTDSISRCVNYGSVTLDAAAVGACSVGGIVAEMAAACSVSHCDNHGKVLNSSGCTTNKAVFAIGGLVGLASANGTLEYCDNYAQVEYNNSTSVAYASCYISNMLGYTLTSPLAKFENCVNHKGGDILTVGPSYFVSGGGFIGQYEITTPITNCTNEADLSLTGTASYHYVGGAVGNIPLSVTAGVISGCKVNSGVTLTGTTTGGLRAGVFMGALASKCTMENCSCEGKVVNQSVSSKGTRLGGLIGSISSGSGTITGCTADCEIINDAAAMPDGNVYLGGLTSYNTGTFPMTSCSFKGSITSLKTAATAEYVGGAVGYNTKTIAFTKCSVNCSVDLADDTNLANAGAFAGKTANPTITNCSVHANTFAGIELTSSNYGTYLKGTSSTTATNINTTNVSFEE